MKLILTLSLLINAYFAYFLFIEDIGLVEREYQHSAVVHWERDPAFFASMSKIAHKEPTKLLGMYLPHYNTIIMPVPRNNYELMTLGHEFMHAVNYKHK